MSLFDYAICTTFLISIICALPAPRVVYTAVIYNKQSSPIQCTVFWSQPSNSLLESEPFTVEKYDCYLTEDKIIDMGSWEARGIIEEIRCGNLTLSAPFHGVSSPQISWGFLIKSNKILSMGPALCNNKN